MQPRAKALRKCLEAESQWDRKAEGRRDRGWLGGLQGSEEDTDISEAYELEEPKRTETKAADWRKMLER